MWYKFVTNVKKRLVIIGALQEDVNFFTIFKNHIVNV